MTLLMTEEARRAARLCAELHKLLDDAPLSRLLLMRDAARPGVDDQVRRALAAARAALPPATTRGTRNEPTSDGGSRR
ncbi:MAG: hypothetical protein OXG35_32465 [Acidobacteria bacterium]|nr:hypothetical protein [Acidobacteriota bacterium]